jgi:hypothetical protein
VTAEGKREEYRMLVTFSTDTHADITLFGDEALDGK